MKNCHMNYFKQQDKHKKIRNDFSNKMSTDTKLSKTQISKIIQSGEFLCNMLGNLGKKSNSRSCYSFSWR